MTNRDMVKAKGPRGGEPPRPNRSKHRPVPTPESDPPGLTCQDPVDSPQLKPMIRQRKTKGLKVER
jgi:hypothetical protein